MKLLSFLLFVSVVSVTANSYSQQTKFNMNLENITVRQVFQQIEENSEFILLYSEESVDVDRRVSVKVNDESINSVLDQVFKGTNNRYEIHDRQIAILLKDKSQLPAVLNANQQKDISGKVIDSSGQPLPGASIVIKGTSSGTITNFDGNFNLSNVSTNATLVFSFVGMKTQEIKIAGQTVFNIVMEEDAIGLEEVVAVGYGVTTKRDLTGAVSSMKSDDIETSVISNVAEALSGRLAGVQVSTPTGAPGGGVNIQIRGINSINGSSDPLYVMDNFVGVDPSTIDPSEISNIEVLKDASATAIYGSLGANGVIIITTNNLSKKGKSGISFNVTNGLNEVIKQFDMMDGRGYYHMLPLKVPYKDIFQLWAEEYKDEVGVNWQEEALRKIFYQTYRLSANGSNGDTKYYTSLSYTDEPGIIINTGYEKLTFSLLGEHRFNKTIALKTGFNYSKQENTGLASSGQYGAYYTLLYQRPHFGNYDLLNSDYFFDENGVPLENGVNPITNLENAQTSNINQTFRGNADLTVNLLPSVKFVAKVARQWNFINGESFLGAKTLSGSWRNGVATLGSIRRERLINDNLLYYTPKLGDGHKFNAMAGFTQQEFVETNLSNTASGFNNEVLGALGLPTGNDHQIPGVTKLKWTLNSFIGRINYSYKDKYLFTSTFRADGASKFGDGNKWAYFPSVSFAWRAGEEQFIKDIAVISNLKTRISYGHNGSQGIQPYASLSRYGSANYTLDNALTIGIAPSSVPNEKLKWETTKQLDVGVELGLFNHRLSATFDYYHKKTTDLLLNVSIPATTGFNEFLMNFGSLKNQGVELALTGIPVKKRDFEWNVSFNISRNKNEVLQLSGDNSYKLLDAKWDDRIVNEFILKEGESIGSMYGYVFDGLYQLDDFVYDDEAGPYELKGNVPKLAGKTVYGPGHVKYKDINGDGIVDSNDRTLIGNSNPELYGGFGNTFKYKNISLNMFFTWQYNADVLNGNKIYLERATGTNNNMTSVLDYWSLENRDTNIPAPGIEPAGPWLMSDRYIEDASYLRLKTISVNYKLPKRMIRWSKLKNLSVELAAKNLLTFTDYSGSDPEVTTTGRTLTKGVDFATYPVPRTYVISIKANL